MRPVFASSLTALALGALAGCNAPETRPTQAPNSPAAPAVPTVPAAPAALVLPAGFSLTAPEAGATTASPVTVTGSAPGDWYFEAVFDAQLLAADGSVLAEAPAQAQGDWMTTGPVPFKAVLPYAVTAAQVGTVVLTEDQTGENLPPPREVRIPVRLVPAP